MANEKKQVLMHIESAAKACGFTLERLLNLLALPEGTPRRPTHLHLIDNEYLDADEVKKFVKRSRERQMQAPTVTDELLLEKMEIIRRNLRGVQDAAIVAVSNFAGLRVGEISKLTMAHVLDVNGEFRTISALERNLTKTKQPREIFFTNEHLQHYLKPWIAHRMIDKPEPYDPLFIAPRGKGFDPNNLQQYIKRIYRRVGLPKLSSHSGRAATVKRCLNSGETLQFAAKVVGHRSVNTTSKYERYHSDEIAEKVARMS